MLSQLRRIMLLTIFSLVGRRLASAVDVYYAVNCGGPLHYSDSDGILYVADVGYSGGETSRAGLQFSPFPGVKDDVVYHTERYHTGLLSYRIPLRQEGEFTIVLKFAEVYFDAPQKKVFGVAVGGHVVIDQLDIFAVTGGRGRPYEVYISVSRHESGLNVNGGPALESKWDKWSEEVIIDFLPITPYDNPKINAIVVYDGRIQDSPRASILPDDFEDISESADLCVKDAASMEKILQQLFASNPNVVPASVALLRQC